MTNAPNSPNQPAPPAAAQQQPAGAVAQGDPNAKTSAAPNAAPANQNPAPIAPAKAKAKAAEPVPIKKVAALHVTRWQIGDFMNTRHSIVPEAGTPWESILQPEYLANITRLKSGDIIEVRPEDSSYYAELFVLAKGRNWATVAVLREPVKLIPAGRAPSSVAAYEAVFKGSLALWCVIRLSDNTMMKDRLPTEADARAWIVQLERSLAA